MIAGGFATVMVVVLDEERPVPVSVTAMVRVSDPRVVLVSVNVAKAVLIAAGPDRRAGHGDGGADGGRRPVAAHPLPPRRADHDLR